MQVTRLLPEKPSRTTSGSCVAQVVNQSNCNCNGVGRLSYRDQRSLQNADVYAIKYVASVIPKIGFICKLWNGVVDKKMPYFLL